MKFNIKFVGRPRGAIGVFSNYNLTIEGANRYAAYLTLYREYELHHVVSADIEGGPVGKKQLALSLLPELNLAADFHTLNSDTVLQLCDVMRLVGYRAPKHRNGSPARCFFEYLAKGSK